MAMLFVHSRAMRTCLSTVRKMLEYIEAKLSKANAEIELE